LAHPGRERALRRFRPSGGPRARGGGERRGREGDGVAWGPLASERGGKGRRFGQTAGEPAERGEKPAAGEAGRRRKRLTGEEDDAGALRIGLGEGEERDGRSWCEKEGARGKLFIGARGKGGGGAP
jgi:hypothetical protein